MKVEFYKPNRSATGTACSFEYKLESGDLFLNFVKQATWDDATRKGTFHKDDKTKKGACKFTETEIAGLILAIEDADRPLDFVHKSNNGASTSMLKFTPYVKDGVDKGMSLSLLNSTAEEKKSFLMGFTHPEKRQLKAFFEEVLRQKFNFVKPQP